MKKKLIKRESLEYDLEGPIDDAIAYLQHVKSQNPHTEFTIECDSDGYSDIQHLYLCSMRDETYAESEARIAQEVAIKANCDEYERRQYEALKAKFEK